MKNKKRHSLLSGSIILILIITTPYLLYFYQSIPADFSDEMLIENWETIFGVVQGGRYMKAQTFIYYFFSKFVPLLLLFIWFITNKHWWVHSLIIPISVYTFQLISVVNDSEEFFDSVDFIYSVPITAIILVILYFIRSKMAIYILAMDLKKEMDENMKVPKKIK